MKRRPRVIEVPTIFTNTFYPDLQALASSLKTQELLGDNNNLPKRWANAYRRALQAVMAERIAEGRIAFRDGLAPQIRIPCTKQEAQMLEWFRTEGGQKVG